MVHILYYYGVVQKVVLSLGCCLQSIIGTTICESVNAASNIFLGMVSLLRHLRAEEAKRFFWVLCGI